MNGSITTITKHSYMSLEKRLKEIARAWRELEKFGRSVWRDELMSKLLAEFVRLIPQAKYYGFITDKK
ncbi:MAG TPA: hypothetical protein VGL07_16855 [Buttiauxella sp.]|jgi:hypothetical protein